jgi:DeoR/GlpR family transcriptional regulator of sugar metabolism
MAKVVRKVPPRVFCEDGSTLLKTIRSHKDHGKVKVIDSNFMTLQKWRDNQIESVLLQIGKNMNGFLTFNL